mmetsp:Transcript_4088/g.8785  ORF Transcript_4088/g.8785 Transcript_4088/m.8785 type:complete len:201 (+) Transcript_4088:2063-2665(+)
MILPWKISSSHHNTAVRSRYQSPFHILFRPFSVKISTLPHWRAPRAPWITAPNTVKCVVTHTNRSGSLSSRDMPSVIHTEFSSSQNAHLSSSPSPTSTSGCSSSTEIGSSKSKMEISSPWSFSNLMLTGWAANVCAGSSSPSAATGRNEFNSSSLKTVTTATAPGPAIDSSASTGMEALTLLPGISNWTFATPSVPVCTS